MWELNNSTPYKADRAWVRDYDGREVWIVAVRARFRIVSGADAIWDTGLEQPDVMVAPSLAGDGLSCYLQADSDLVHEKHATDVLLSGQARAHRGHLSTKMIVRMAVGPIDKRVAVFGDRLWSLGRASKPHPFDAMPIEYSRAYGGTDAADTSDAPTDWVEANPAGVGYSSRAHALEGTRLPNIEDPANLIVSQNDRPSPAGFGAILWHWPSRRRYSGTYDQHWEKERLPLLPKDFDPRFHQQAPEDQQVKGFLRGGEPVRLEGVHPDGPLDFRLPRVSLAFETEFDDLTEIKHNADLYTVVFEPDFPAVTLVWQTHIECHSRVNMLLETRIWERKRVRAVSGRVV